jgi:hypothetical protein
LRDDHSYVLSQSAFVNWNTAAITAVGISVWAVSLLHLLYDPFLFEMVVPQDERRLVVEVEVAV